jgi:adenosylhomocysteine nucleosidase
MERPRLLILTALQIEQRAILSARRLREDQEVEYAVIGPRARHLPTQTNQIAGIVLAGLSGALDPALRVGDVVIDVASTLPLRGEVSYRRAIVHTSDQLVATPANKASLFSSAGAAVVDMESDIVRRFALERGVPLLNIRAVGDAACDAVDPTILTLVDEAGATKMAAVAKAIVTRPNIVADLMRLRAASRIALENLARALWSLL